MKRLNSMAMVLSFLAATAQYAAAANGQINGYVRNSSGVGVPSIRVSAIDGPQWCPAGSYCPPTQQVQTNAQGYYTFTENLGNTLGSCFYFQMVAEQVNSSGQVVVTGTPYMKNIGVGIPIYTAGCPSVATVNFTLNPVALPSPLKSGDICYESSCGTDIIANMCNLCPNGSKAINNSRKIYCDNGLVSTLTENVCN